MKTRINISPHVIARNGNNIGNTTNRGATGTNSTAFGTQQNDHGAHGQHGEHHGTTAGGASTSTA